jgi:hypothetical protein
MLISTTKICKIITNQKDGLQTTTLILDADIESKICRINILSPFNIVLKIINTEILRYLGRTLIEFANSVDKLHELSSNNSKYISNDPIDW